MLLSVISAMAAPQSSGWTSTTSAPAARVALGAPGLADDNVFTGNNTFSFLLLDTAQVNYLSLLGSINQQGQLYTNYFMADTNYYRGSIGSPSVYGVGLFGNNLELGLGSDSSAFLTSDGGIAAGDLSNSTDSLLQGATSVAFGNLYNSYSSVIKALNGSFAGGDLASASNSTVFANNGAIAAGNLVSSSNVTVNVSSGLAIISAQSKKNVKVTANNSVVVGSPPSGQTNTLDHAIAVIAPDGTVSGINTNGLFGNAGANLVTTNDSRNLGLTGRISLGTNVNENMRAIVTMDSDIDGFSLYSSADDASLNTYVSGGKFTVDVGIWANILDYNISDGSVHIIDLSADTLTVGNGGLTTEYTIDANHVVSAGFVTTTENILGFSGVTDWTNTQNNNIVVVVTNFTGAPQLFNNDNALVPIAVLTNVPIPIHNSWYLTNSAAMSGTFWIQ